MKVRDLLRQLSDDGWYLSRQSGSHRQFKHPDKPETVTVPRHSNDEFHPKTLQSILKQAGLKP
ncbi:MAG: type II toxin-antitoxin system HicA family toxin [Acidobacteriaceae bacterium]|nr:type II toxin-antitoxin system HicA family toxin [Acidobacteriaceae bacterium]